MPIVAPVAPASTTPTAAAPSPADGFDAALRAATEDHDVVPNGRAVASGDPSAATRVGQLPSIRLAQMIAVRADGSAGSPAASPADVTHATEVAAVAGVGGRSGGVDDPDGILAAGERYLGVPYRWGGTDPATGMDCSGFVQRVFADLGVALPRVSADQARAGQPVASLEQARPGDLVYWNGSGSSPNHIGIYAGDGQMLVAPSTGDVVKYQDISRTPHAIRRVH